MAVDRPAVVDRPLWNEGFIAAKARADRFARPSPQATADGRPRPCVAATAATPGLPPQCHRFRGRRTSRDGRASSTPRMLHRSSRQPTPNPPFVFWRDVWMLGAPQPAAQYGGGAAMMRGRDPRGQCATPRPPPWTTVMRSPMKRTTLKSRLVADTCTPAKHACTKTGTTSHSLRVLTLPGAVRRDPRARDPRGRRR